MPLPNRHAENRPSAALRALARASTCLLCAATRLTIGYCASPALQPFGNPEIAQRAPQRSYHVENYRLALHFEEARSEVFGDELVTLEPLHARFERFYLDSTGLRIDAVSLVSARTSVHLSFQRRDPRLWIRLDHAYLPQDHITVRIIYHGFPRAGLYFVSPTAAHPDRPREVWSQGEPEFNHHWFPCWDYPNDMSTSEIIATVPNGQSVVSNGKLVKVTRHAGEITYDWVESIRHSSYLTSIAVGPWRKVADHEGRLPVDYYVPSTVSAAEAWRSFHLTPDMIGFYSGAFDIPYPYEQYAQVAVRNYPFGGMENVSATTLTAYTLHATRAEPQFSSRALVAHELGQQWFGDLVQAKDWADIWLNEGFATYLEALYTQYHDGNDAFRYEMWQDQLAAEREDRKDYLRPIVDDHFRYPLQMFDSATHEKGAVVLDMLRNILDGSREASQPASQRELFFRALYAYLTRFRTRVVDTADLISAIDTATGRHLRGFFREWVFGAGYPHYRFTARYDPTRQAERVTITQLQRGRDVPRIFTMPIRLAFHGRNGEARFVRVLDSARSQRFDIPLRFEPAWVDFDPNDVIEKTLDFEQSESAMIAAAEGDPAVMSRLAAVERLSAIGGSGSTVAVAALSHVLEHDSFYGVRVSAAAGLGRVHSLQAEAALLRALLQADSRVRVAVIEALAAFHRNRSVYAALVRSLHDDPSGAVQAAAAAAIGESGMSDALQVLEAMSRIGPDIHVMRGIFTGLAATGAPDAEALLLHYAEPGMPQRMRLDALEALAQSGSPGGASHRTRLIQVALSALKDPFIPVQMAGESLAGADRLSECRQALDRLSHDAPTAFQRAAARAALAEVQETRT